MLCQLLTDDNSTLAMRTIILLIHIVERIHFPYNFLCYTNNSWFSLKIHIFSNKLW